MSRAARWAADALVGTVVAGFVALAVRFEWFREVAPAGDPAAAPGVPIQMAIVGIAWTVSGMVVVWRTRNPVGWVSIAVGLCFGLQWIGWEVMAAARAGQPVGPLAGAAGAILEASWFPATLLTTVVLPLIFPTGRLSSRRSAWVGWVALAAFLAYIAYTSAMSAAGRPTESFGDEDPFTYLLLGLLLIGVGGAVTSMAARFRRAGPVERQQLKWIVAALGVVGLVIFLLFLGVLSALLGPRIGPLLGFASFGLVPLATLASILRYRLFDIDRLVGWTVTYFVVMGLLAAVYLGLAVALRGLVRVEGDLAVAISTLAVAFAFLPLARRVRRLVDRRLFRSRYDAASVVARVAEELRQSVDMDAVVGRTVSVVEDVFAPERVGVWVGGEG